MRYQGCVQGTPLSRLRVNSAMDFSPICIQGLPRTYFGGTSNFTDEAKGSSKMTVGAANQNSSFDCKWQLPMEATILTSQSEFFLLIANSGPLLRLSFSKQNCIQSRETNKISLQRPRGATLNVAQIKVTEWDIRLWHLVAWYPNEASL